MTGLKLFDTVKEVEGAVDKVATAKHVKFVGAANAVAGSACQEGRRAAGAAGMLRRHPAAHLPPVAVRQHRRYGAGD